MKKIILILIFLSACQFNVPHVQNELFMYLENTNPQKGVLVEQTSNQSMGAKLSTSLIYESSNDLVRVCLFYKVPEKDDGEFWGLVIQTHESCDNHLLDKPIYRISNIRHLAPTQKGNEYKLVITKSDYKEETLLWTIGSPKWNISPVEMEEISLVDGTVCEEKDDECSVLKKSECNRCEHGFYMVHNGCPGGARKICGSIECGVRGNPACYRGVVYQRVRKKYSCREDDSFVFCQQGLKINCQGSLAFCL